MADPFSVRIRVRYNECDIQGIVFNANYLVYVDEAIDRWITEVLGVDGIDYLVKKASVEWSASARRGELLDLSPHVSRWGNTSFDITVDGHVERRGIFVATLTCVHVVPGTKTPTPVPGHVRAAFGAGSRAG